MLEEMMNEKIDEEIMDVMEAFSKTDRVSKESTGGEKTKYPTQKG
jgi:hypothetical protein